MKRLICLLMCLALLFGAAVLAQAGGTVTQNGADQLEEEFQFPFLAETDELAVNVRKSTSTKADRVGRLERGTLLTVLSAEINGQGEVWYRVELADGTQGYIRSDLLLKADEAAIERAQTQSTQSTKKTSSSSGQYIGNRNTKKFHRPSCHTLPKESNRVYFSSREKAVSSGYVPCKNCNP
ncbi:MAG: Ada metal-binding domain-containing protein [Candidatus Ventricola sp.]